MARYKITLPDTLEFEKDWAGDYISADEFCQTIDGQWLDRVGATIEEVKVLASDLPPGTLVRVKGETVTWYKTSDGWINPRGNRSASSPTFLDSFDNMYGLEIHYDPRERNDAYSR